MELLFCLLFICAHNFALANVNWHTTGCVKLHYFFFVLFCCPCFSNWHVAFVWNGDRFRFCCLFEITYYHFFFCLNCLFAAFFCSFNLPNPRFSRLQSLARLCHSAQPVLVWWMHYVSHASTNWLVTSIFAACKSRACLCGSVMQIWKNCHFHTFYRLEHPCL